MNYTADIQNIVWLELFIFGILKSKFDTCIRKCMKDPDECFTFNTTSSMIQPVCQPIITWYQTHYVVHSPESRHIMRYWTEYMKETGGSRIFQTGDGEGGAKTPSTNILFSHPLIPPMLLPFADLGGARKTLRQLGQTIGWRSWG